MSHVAQIPIPVPYLDTGTLWLWKGDPLPLVDAGPASTEALTALEQGLAEQGCALADIEQLLLTHHHLDHAGLVPVIRERSGATVVAHRGTAQWGASYHERARAEQRFSEALMLDHGVPAEIVAQTTPFFEDIIRQTAAFTTDRVLLDGDSVEAGGLTLRAVFRPGHSTTDTLFVDDDHGNAFVGDHLLANITSGAEIMPTELPGDERRRALLEYLSNLRKTEVMQLTTCYPGHGPTITDHRSLITERLAFHSDRLDRIAVLVAGGAGTAFEIARRLWSDEVAETQPVLVTWEVIGHLDILVNRGTVRESVDDLGHHHFRPRETISLAQR